MVVRALTLILVVLPAWRVLGCQCGSRPSLTQALARKELVVTGVILGQHPAAVSRNLLRFPGADELPPWLPVTKIEIGVTRVFKGNPADRIILTHIGCCVCEERFETGKEYLLFVSPSWDVTHAQMVSFCDPNQESPTSKQLTVLGTPKRINSDRFRSTLGQALAHRADYVANLTARFLLARRNEDRAESLMEWPWLGFAVAVTSGVLLGAIIVIARRRFARKRGG